MRIRHSAAQRAGLSIRAVALGEHGDTAVIAHEEDEYLNYHGQVQRSRFRMTDTWLRTPSSCMLLVTR
jgi:hypothetical protein